MTFEEWIISVFDHPVEQPQWERSATWWDGPPTTALEYMTCLFAEADTVLAPFSDTQAEQGLLAMCNGDISDYPLLLTDTSLPLRSREACIEAMNTLFVRFFARRCSPHLSHLDITKTPDSVSPLNGVCYVWWDVLPLGCLSRLEWPVIQNAMISVFRNCLESDAIACQESAIRGLMSWSWRFDPTSEFEELEDVKKRVLSQVSGAWPALYEFSGRMGGS